MCALRGRVRTYEFNPQIDALLLLEPRNVKMLGNEIKFKGTERVSLSEFASH